MVRETCGSTFFHGVVHGLIWTQRNNGRDTSLPAGAGSTPAEHAIILSLTFTFFYFFLKAKAPLVVLQSIVHTVLATFVVPSLYGFAYVNTVIYINTLAPLLLAPPKEKDVFYDLRSILSLPVLLMTWIEPLTCDWFLIEFGGHVWFDISIPASSMLYYAVASKLPPRDQKAKSG